LKREAEALNLFVAIKNELAYANCTDYVAEIWSLFFGSTFKPIEKTKMRHKRAFVEVLKRTEWHLPQTYNYGDELQAEKLSGDGIAEPVDGTVPQRPHNYIELSSRRSNMLLVTFLEDRDGYV
jgi:hypothetical protein